MKISIAWGFIGVGIFISALLDHMRCKRTEKELIESSYNIAEYCFSSMEELIGFINDRCDDLTEEEEANIRDLWETLQKAKRHLPRNKHS